MVSRSAMRLLPCALLVIASSIAFAQDAGVTLPADGSPTVGDMGTSAARQADRAMKSDGGAASNSAGASAVTHGHAGTSAYHGDKTHTTTKQRSDVERPVDPAKSPDGNATQRR